MNTDIRISTSFRGHRKVKKLKLALGSEAVLCLIYLWIGVAQSKPKGVLEGWDADDICLEAEWGGDSNDFVETLLKLRLLEKNFEGTFCMHNWDKRQAWVVGADERSRKASHAAKARWEKQNICVENASSNAHSIMHGAYKEDSNSNAPILSSPTLSDITYQGRNKYRKADNGQGWVNTQTGEFVTELTPFDKEVVNV